MNVHCIFFTTNKTDYYSNLLINILFLFAGLYSQNYILQALEFMMVTVKIDTSTISFIVVVYLLYREFNTL